MLLLLLLYRYFLQLELYFIRRHRQSTWICDAFLKIHWLFLDRYAIFIPSVFDCAKEACLVCKTHHHVNCIINSNRNRRNTVAAMTKYNSHTKFVGIFEYIVSIQLYPGVYSKSKQKRRLFSSQKRRNVSMWRSLYHENLF